MEIKLYESVFTEQHVTLEPAMCTADFTHVFFSYIGHKGAVKYEQIL